MTTTSEADRSSTGTSPTPLQPDNAEAPSGFILKLFQMVNGAPDEVISWTPSGDAFIIGSDLKRLESETLPQYFRHNRFQSLVRQLNFYSFRKINRERNVWIYQHQLFHRDRPEDLYLVRRRTCPGLDGRKQRFSRFSARRLSQSESDVKSDDSSVDAVSEDDVVSDVITSCKRETDVLDPVQPPESKRSRQMSDERKEPPESRRPRQTAVERKEPELEVDTSMLRPKTPEKEVIKAEHLVGVSLTDPVTDRVEMVEQSVIVSEVAMKLEKYARKAMKGRTGSRTRRSGVVTPPYGASGWTFFSSSSSLLTYDDEVDESEDNNLDRSVSDSGFSIITEADDASEESVTGHRASVAALQQLNPPVPHRGKIDDITDHLFQFVDSGADASLLVPATVARFCMSTSPRDEELCDKILKLIESSVDLASEFSLYRAALHPSLLQEPSKMYPSATVHRESNRLGHRIWERDASRSDAVRDFKIFAMNSLNKVLGIGNPPFFDNLSVDDKLWLERTSTIWQQSVGA